MPNLERNMHQTMTYWKRTGEDKFGKPTFDAPVTVKCRWEHKIEAIRDKRGEEFVTRSRIYCTRAIDLDGYVYLGTSTATAPTTLEDASEIRMVGVSPDLRNLKSLTVVYI